MDLITPSLGLLFWTGITFCLLLFILAKFVWKPILNAVNARTQKIEEALSEADKTREDMKNLHAENDRILKEARLERDEILKEAKTSATAMIDEAKNKAKLEGVKMMDAALAAIQNEKNSAIQDMKSQIASFSVEIAERILREELSSETKQKDLANKLTGEINLN